jgi:hypothetical protein
MDAENARVAWMLVGVGLTTVGLSRSRLMARNHDDDGSTADMVFALGATCILGGLALWLWPYVRP